MSPISAHILSNYMFLSRILKKGNVFLINCLAQYNRHKTHNVNETKRPKFWNITILCPILSIYLHTRTEIPSTSTLKTVIERFWFLLFCLWHVSTVRNLLISFSRPFNLPLPFFIGFQKKNMLFFYPQVLCKRFFSGTADLYFFFPNIINGRSGISVY